MEFYDIELDKNNQDRVHSWQFERNEKKEYKNEQKCKSAREI